MIVAGPIPNHVVNHHGSKRRDHQFRYNSLMHTMVTEYGIHVRILGEPSVLPSALLMDYDLMLSLKQLDLLLSDLHFMVSFLFCFFIWDFIFTDYSGMVI